MPQYPHKNSWTHDPIFSKTSNFAIKNCNWILFSLQSNINSQIRPYAVFFISFYIFFLSIDVAYTMKTNIFKIKSDQSIQTFQLKTDNQSGLIG